jgi:VWFA-related protein
MRKLILLTVLAAMPLPALAARHVTIEQLQQILAAQQAAHKNDNAIADQVASLELTEELTTETLRQFASQFEPGPKAAQALELLADSSAFLVPPASELPATPRPDIATQRALLTAAINYVVKTEHHLPDFIATRVTRSFDNLPQVLGDSEVTPYLTLHSVGVFNRPITYRNGQEVIDTPASTSAAAQKPAPGPSGLASWGEFGPVLAIILTDSTKGRVIWNRWQQTSTGPVAVFHYQVPKDASHFVVNYCCAWQNFISSGTSLANRPIPFADRRTPLTYHGTPGYHGDLYIDPATGTILRSTLEAELSHSDIIWRAAISVQYGKVDIGGQSFICPIRSVALTQAPLHPRGTGPDADTKNVAPDADTQITRINEVRFTDYHRFGTSMRILAESEENAPLTAPESPNPPAAPVSQPGTVEAQAAPANPPTAPPQPVPPATVAAASAPPPATPAPPESTQLPAPTFTTTTRDVVEEVVVRKGNGDPVLGLQKQNFQITEDGKPQSINFFEQHTASAASSAAPPPQMPLMPPGARTNVPPAPAGDAVNVLLIDTLNTAPQDQSYVHGEIMDFLKKMQPGTQLAVFALGAKLRFIQGFTTDTAVLRAAISDKHQGVTPQKDAASRTASDSADDASSVSTLRTMQMSEAGIAALAAAQANQSGYQFGERVSMTFQALNYLASYLAGVPGRKNLIWFASSFPVTVFPTAAQKRQMNQLPGYLSQSRHTADLLSVSNVAVYPVGAQGIMSDSAAGADSSSPTGTPDAGSGHIGDMASSMSTFSGAASQRAGTIASMEQLAADTGGRAFYNTNDLNSALKSAIADGSTYYTLVYSPTNTKMDGSYRQIAVNLDKGKYKLAYRTGYNADDSAAQPADPATGPVSDPLGPLLRFGLPGATGILYGVQAAPAATQPAPDAPLAGQNWKLKGPVTRYNVDFVIRPEDVVLQPATGGKRTGKILVGLMAYDRSGQAVNWAGGTEGMDVEPGTYASIQKSGIPAHLVIDLPANADVQLVTGVYDWNTGLAGTLEIPIHPAATTATATTPASSRTY